MKQVLLDTNFILTCVKQKIDFFKYLESEGFEVLIPQQIILELKKVSKSKQKLHFRDDAKLALSIIFNKGFKKVNLNSKNVDAGIIKFAEKNPKAIQDYASGNKNALQFLAGQVMAKTRGTANPKSVQEVLKKLL